MRKKKEKPATVYAYCWKNDLGLRPPTTETRKRYCQERAREVYLEGEEDGVVVRVLIKEISK